MLLQSRFKSEHRVYKISLKGVTLHTGIVQSTMKILSLQLPVAIYFHSMKKKLLRKSMATVNHLVINILKNIFFCAQLKKEIHIGLEQDRLDCPYFLNLCCFYSKTYQRPFFSFLRWTFCLRGDYILVRRLEFENTTCLVCHIVFIAYLK